MKLSRVRGRSRRQVATAGITQSARTQSDRGVSQMGVEGFARMKSHISRRSDVALDPSFSP